MPSSVREARKTSEGAFIRAAKQDEVHGLAGLKQQRYGVLQVPSAEASSHNEYYREVIVAQVQDLFASRTRVGGLLEDGVYGDTCRMDALFGHT